MQNITLLLLLVMPIESNAIFSAFLPISKSGNSEFEVVVELNQNRCTVRFEAIEFPRKQAWLILSESELDEKAQELRPYIWGQNSELPKELILKTKLSPLYGRQISKIESEDLLYEITLSSDLARKAYVYIDFPTKTYDGGLYYSIDIGSYCDG